VNIVAGNREQAEAFYFGGLGLTRDPARAHGRTFWANLGKQQFHVEGVSEEPPQAVNGYIGLALPSVEDTLRRLRNVESLLAGTMFQIQEGEAGQPPVVVCPWGNHFVLLKAKSETPFGHPDGPGIRFVAFRVNSGHADKIAQFYSETYATPTSSKLGGESRASTVVVSPCSRFVFFEEQSPPERVQAQKGLHVAIYVAPFTSTFEKLHARSLVRSNPRFTHIDRCDTREEALASRQCAPSRHSVSRAQSNPQVSVLPHD